MSEINQKKTLIAFATAWGTRFGGVNAFNADLLRAVASAFFSRLQVICVVLSATSDEVSNAKSFGVVLADLKANGVKDFRDEFEPKVWECLQETLIGWVPSDDTIWLGHDRITGGIAIAASSKRGGLSALIHHMSYAHYEAFAENSQKADEKVAQQKQLFQQARYRLAVGPLLKDALDDLLDTNDTVEIIPGLAEIEPRANAPKNFKVYLSGRLSDDAKKVKQAHLGLAGFAYAVSLCDANAHYPDPLKGCNQPKMQLRGVDFEKHSNGDTSEAEVKINQFVEEHARRQLALSLLPFIEDRQRLFDDLRSASVALMPSWHEGFGLVAWEAIAGGVPLVLSRNSGVFKLLERTKLAHHVTAIDTRGQVSDPFFADEDKRAVADAIISIAKSPQKSLETSAQLRESLLKQFTWPQCAKQLVGAFGWQLDLPVPTSPTSICRTPLLLDNGPVQQVKFLELPAKYWQRGRGFAVSQLLRAEEGIVPFDPARKPFLEEQLAWCKDTPWPIGVRLLIGQGGAGKTRLGLELCAELAKLGWNAGLLPGKVDEQSIKKISEGLSVLTSQGQSCCLVIDYAETRQGALLALLTFFLQNPVGRANIRFLLLARDGGEWWAQLPNQNSVCESLLLGEASSGPYLVPELHQGSEARKVAYLTALERFALELDMDKPKAVPNLDEPYFSHPLYVQIAALLAMHGELPQSAASLTRALVGHEQRYWDSATSALPSHFGKEARTLMTLATLTGGVSTVRDIEDVWFSADLPRTALKPLWNALQPLYPGEQGLQGLRPDLLGEALVANALLTTQGSGVLDALLGNSATAAMRLNTLTVIARLLRVRKDVEAVVEATLQKHFSVCAQHICKVGVSTPSPLIEVAARSFTALKPNQQAQVTGLLGDAFEFDTLPLTRLEVVVEKSRCDQLSQKLKKTPTDVEKRYEFAGALLNLSIAYGRDGMQDAAQKRSWQALEIREELAKQNPGRFELSWAHVLSHHANVLTENGQHSHALKLSQQALDIYQKLANREPVRFEQDLALGLLNHSNRLAEDGQNTKALELSQRALSIYQTRAIDDPENFEFYLAIGLNGNSNRLSEDGQYAEALEKSQLAMEINQKLAAQKPERFEHNWALSLHNLANDLSVNGKREKALQLSLQALNIYQKLTLQKPERFESDFAWSLESHSFILAENGQLTDALELFPQAISVYERLVQKFPQTYSIDLIQSKLNLALIQWIHDGSPFELAELASDIQVTNRRKHVISFLQAVLLLLRNSNADEQILRAFADKTNAAWFTLDKGQQFVCQDMLHLYAGVVSQRLGLKAVPQEWRAQWQAYCIRHEHKIPEWVSKGFARCGIQHPIN